MSVFYCEYHDCPEDSDYVGYYVINGMEVCEDASFEIDAIEEYLSQVVDKDTEQ